MSRAGFSFWEDSSTRETVCFSIVNSWQLLLFRGVIAVCCEKYTQKYEHSVFAQSSTFKVALDGTFGNTRALKFECLRKEISCGGYKAVEGAYHIVENGIYVESFHRNVSSEDETLFLLV